MKKHLFKLDTSQMKSLAALMLLTGALGLTSCKDDDGLTAGDPNYFTSSRGQFTAALDDNTTLYLLPGSTAGTATLTYDGSNPRHWQSQTTATVNVTTYQGDLTLPEEVTTDGKSYSLTAIGSEAMMGCRKLTTVTLPQSVQKLGDGAFAICTTLTGINLPEGITEIPTGCFGYCPKLAAVTLPSTVTAIGSMAFYGCTALTSITVPAAVTTIGDRAFYDSGVTEFHLQSATPPTLTGVLCNLQESAAPVVYVPAGAKAAYEAATGWKELTIEEE